MPLDVKQWVSFLRISHSVLESVVCENGKLRISIVRTAIIGNIPRTKTRHSRIKLHENAFGHSTRR